MPVPGALRLPGLHSRLRLQTTAFLRKQESGDLAPDTPIRLEGASRPAPGRRDLGMRSPAKAEGRIRESARIAWGQTTLANRPTPLPLSDGERSEERRV